MGNLEAFGFYGWTEMKKENGRYVEAGKYLVMLERKAKALAR